MVSFRVRVMVMLCGLKNSLLECNVCVLQTYVFQQKNSDIYADGWKWQSRGSCKRPIKEPLYRRSLYFYHGQDGVERSFQRLIYERLDEP